MSGARPGSHGTAASTASRATRLPEQMVRGQRGVDLIERVVLEMGCISNQTGAIDVGIDGRIELCDPATRSVGIFVHVQSKATDGKWEWETGGSILTRMVQ